MTFADLVIFKTALSAGEFSFFFWDAILDSGCTRNKITTETKSLRGCGVVGPGGGLMVLPSSHVREKWVFFGGEHSPWEWFFK